MRYVIKAEVVGVEEKTRVVSANVVDRNLPTQRIESTRESMGWFVTVTGGASFCLGSQRPELEVGDTVKISIDKMVILESE
jgi:hypothetical protein